MTVRLAAPPPPARTGVLAPGRVITSTASSRRTSRAPTTPTPSRRPGDPAAERCRGRPRHAARISGRPRDEAAGPLHRGHADPRARGAADRPPVDVRLDHRHDPEPRLRVQEGHRAGAGLAGVLGHPAARGALHPAGRPTSSPRSMEDVLDEIAGGRRDRNAELARSTSATATGGPQDARHRARRHRRPRALDVPDRATASSCGSAATARTSRTPEDGDGARCGPTSPRTCRPTS